MADTRPSLSVLHLASFTGNIGDNANHLGARAQFDKNLPFQFGYTELEMREFFWGQRQWDDNFVAYANKFDLLLIGGKNYFELWVEKSRSGCSIELTLSQLEAIHCPILFYGLGVDAGQGVPDVCQTRFQAFLEAILVADNRLIAVRNDGAMATLERYFPRAPLNRVLQVPDGGFFYQSKAQTHPELKADATNITINLAGDMLETRFPGTAGRHDVDGFLAEFIAVLQQQLQSKPKTQIIFVPHIFRDLDIIHQALLHFDDPVRRQHVAVASYLTGENGCRKLFDLYRQSDLCLGMRFHANVVPLAMGTPTIGLVCYPQIAHLYREIQLPEQTVEVNRAGFSEQLATLLNSPLQRPDISEIERQLLQAHSKFGEWLNTRFEDKVASHKPPFDQRLASRD
jgi:polysaccharide pyruvyl transferase WcaK-like protein